MEDDDRTTEEGTQEVLDSQSLPGSPEIDSTSQFDDTIPTEQEEEDTQVLEDTDLIEIDDKTQIPDSDGEKTDGTEVLSENEDDDCEKGTELVQDDEIGSELEKGLDDIGYLNEENCGSGSVPRKSISNHAALLQSDLAAEKEVVYKDNGVSMTRDPASTDMQGREVDSDQGVKKSNGIMEVTREDTNCRVDGSTARRLFATDVAHNSFVEHVADDHTFAGLSYIGSQEPGEQSQAYAIDVVDRLISVDDDKLPLEMNWGSAIKRNSPPVSMTRGSHMLAQRVKPRSPVGDVEIFEWDDNLEDEGGGVFFSKKKEEIFGGSCKEKKSARSKAKKDKGTGDKVGEKEEHSKLGQKTKRLSFSDSRLPVRNLKENTKARPSRSRAIKNLRDELDEQLTMDTSKEQLKDRGVGKDSLNLCDVGIDTQMAVEAMGDLLSGIPSNRGTSVSPEAPNNAEACTVEETKNKSQSKRGALRTRKDYGVMLRQSKRIKTLDTCVSSDSPPENCTIQEMKKIVLGRESNSKGRKAKAEVKAKTIKHLDTRIADNESKIPKCRSSKSVKQPVGKGDDPHIKEADAIHMSSALGGQLSVDNGQLKDGNMASAPVARRTRRSLVVSPLKNFEVSGDDVANVTNGGRVLKKGVKRLGGKSQKNSEEKKLKGFVSESATKCAEGEVQMHLDTQVAVDENRTSCRRSSKRLNQVQVSAMNKTNVKELHKSPLSNEISPLDGELQKESRIGTPIARRTRKSFAVDPSKSSVISCNDIGDGTDVLLVKKGKKRQSMGNSTPKGRTGELVSELLGSSASKAVVSPEQTLEASDGHDTRTEANEQPTTNEKMPRANVVDMGVQSVRKRLTRSSVQFDPSSLSPEKKSQRKRTHQNMSEHTNEVANVDDPPPAHKCETNKEKRARVNATNKKKMTRSSAPIHSSSAMDSKLLSTAKDYLSPAKDLEPKARSHLSPTSNCSTPINAASPVCIHTDDHTKSCKKTLPSSPLVRELNRLDATEVVHDTSALKDSRKRKDMANVRILFSRHLGEDIIKQQKKILVRLGASVVATMSEATHFVTDKFVRTQNMLEAMASGKPVVTHLWLETCAQARCFIDEKNYILRDSKKEKEIRFDMPLSLTRAAQTPLLQSKRVYITPNVKPSKGLIASLVKTVQGEVVEALGQKKDKVPKDVLVLSCEEDYAICVPLLETGVLVYGTELLLNGIVIQKLEYERNRLFPDHVKKTRSTARLRKRN